MAIQNLIEQLEPIQFSAALALTRIWRGTWWENGMQSLAENHLVPVDGVDALFCSIRS